MSNAGSGGIQNAITATCDRMLHCKYAENLMTSELKIGSIEVVQEDVHNVAQLPSASATQLLSYESVVAVAGITAIAVTVFLYGGACDTCNLTMSKLRSFNTWSFSNYFAYCIADSHIIYFGGGFL